MCRRKGLTLIESLVVIAIMATLLGLLVPAIQKVRAAALQSKSTNNLRQIAIAIHHFASVNNGHLPLVVGNFNNSSYKGVLFSTILPYTDYASGYKAHLAHPV